MNGRRGGRGSVLPDCTASPRTSYQAVGLKSVGKVGDHVMDLVHTWMYGVMVLVVSYLVFFSFVHFTINWTL